MFVLNLTDIFTTFWNDPTLKSEVNPIFLKYHLNAFGLVVLLFGYQIANSLFFYYHARVFEGYKFHGDKRDLLNFLRFITWKGQEPNNSFSQKLKNTIKSALNVFGFYCFCDYTISKAIVSIHNFMLAFLTNNSTYSVHDKTNTINIVRNDNPVWDSILGDWIVDYNVFSITNIKDLFLVHYQIQSVLVALLMISYLFCLFKKFLKS